MPMWDGVAPKWDPFRAELMDTIRYHPRNRPKRPCLFCGHPTTAVSQVCTAHDDLPALEAARFTVEPAAPEVAANLAGLASPLLAASSAGTEPSVLMCKGVGLACGAKGEAESGPSGPALDSPKAAV